MLPGLNGLEVCRALRAGEKTAMIPIIMLTARGEESERIFGLDVGADDYMVKPFSPNELMARVRALLRRAAPAAAKELKSGPITMNLERHTVTALGTEVRLTAKEFLLLQYLMEHSRTRGVARSPAFGRLGLTSTPARRGQSTCMCAGCARNCRTWSRRSSPYSSSATS
jgi:DNA-binding response OmpR family regulator